jgi:hypothetical protein
MATSALGRKAWWVGKFECGWGAPASSRTLSWSANSNLRFGKEFLYLLSQLKRLDWMNTERGEGY